MKPEMTPSYSKALVRSMMQVKENSAKTKTINSGKGLFSKFRKHIYHLNCVKGWKDERTLCLALKMFGRRQKPRGQREHLSEGADTNLVQTSGNVLVMVYFLVLILMFSLKLFERESKPKEVKDWLTSFLREFTDRPQTRCFLYCCWKTSLKQKFSIIRALQILFPASVFPGWQTFDVRWFQGIQRH